MAWGLPPKLEVKKQIKGGDRKRLLLRMHDVLCENGYQITQSSEYDIKAYKKLRFTLTSVLNFTRPKSMVWILVDEEGTIRLKLTYGYTDNYGFALYDGGNLKKQANLLMDSMY